MSLFASPAFLNRVLTKQHTLGGKKENQNGLEVKDVCGWNA